MRAYKECIIYCFAPLNMQICNFLVSMREFKQAEGQWHGERLFQS